MNLARARDMEYNRVQLLYVQERFLARLAAGSHRERFVLKGGLYLYSRYGALARPTKDIDLLGQATSSDIQAVVEAMRETVTVELEDGVVFDPDSVSGEAIKQDQEYEGVRVKLTAHLGLSRQTLQIDVGFGDAVTAGPVDLEFPMLLDSGDVQRFTLLAYSVETVVAEKFEAMVSLGEINTRYKDFYDLWRIGVTERLEASVLRAALEATFARRGTPLAEARTVFSLTDDLSATRQQQWAIFQAKTDTSAPQAFSDVLNAIAAFLGPVALQALATGRWEPASSAWWN